MDLVDRTSGSPCPWLALAFLLATLPVTALAYSDGPPDGYANNPPASENCQACHSDLTGDGALALLNVPIAGYTPSQTYTLEVELRDPGQRRWGFELAVIDDTSYLQAGTLVVTDLLNTQLSDNPGTDPDYLKQTSDGSYSGTLNGPVTWQFDWTAPASGNVSFYVAGNAANGNGNPTGDVIYWIQRPVAPVAAIEPVTVPRAAVRLLPGFPNPFAISTTIPFELGAPGRVRLTLHDVNGRVVRILVDASLAAGRQTARWDGRDANGQRTANGVYYLTLAAGNETAVTARIVLAE
jgi:hypothetical protein